jgi:hypothetical protein
MQQFGLREECCKPWAVCVLRRLLFLPTACECESCGIDDRGLIPGDDDVVAVVVEVVV